MMGNFPNLIREKVTQIQGAHRVSIKRNPKKPIARHTIIKVEKFKDKENLKGTNIETGSNIQGSPDKASN